MPPVAEFCEALVAAINAAEAQAALGGACLARRGYQETQALTGQQTRAAWLSPQQWRPLGRCGGLQLEQQLIQLQIVRDQVTPANEPIDADVAIANALRALLLDFDHPASGGRIVDILGPLTLDRQRLTSPGQVSIGLLLDGEFLTGEAATDADPDPAGRLTVARNAVWSAIDHWPALLHEGETLFARQYKTSADFAELQLRDPAPHELPAIAIYWGGIQPAWRNNRLQEWPLSLQLALWLPGDRHTYAETLCEEVFNALYQSRPGISTVSYIEQATGYPPRRVSDLTIQSVTLGRAQQVHALRADVAFTLRSTADPFGDE